MNAAHKHNTGQGTIFSLTKVLIFFFSTVTDIVDNYLHLSCRARIYSGFANSLDPDQLASEEANWSRFTLFAIQYLNLYQQPGSRNLIGWK